jgi:serine hydrolase
MRPVLLAPGIGNSGPTHWQSLWETKYPKVTRIAQRDWDHPVREEWVKALEGAGALTAEPPILVAHSLGCLAVAHWLAQSARPCFAALLVAVPDPAGPAFPREASGFMPLPTSLGPRRITVVSSSDDAYATSAYTEERVATWGAEHIFLGQRGHINAASGLGDWADGWAIVERWRHE